jgi:VIT1/CCC1 family predicted Fe2+/Mn2+ transporter
MTTQGMPTSEDVANPPPAAAQSSARCDVLYEVYTTARHDEAQSWRLVMLFSYATAVLIIVAVAFVLFGSQQAQLASAAVALVSSLAAGAFATRASQKRRQMRDAAADYFQAGCGPDRLAAVLAEA